MRTRAFWLSVACLAGVFPACSGSTTFSGECKRDSDCEQYERCDTLDYRCVCDEDEACAQGEYCNASGSCQVKSGCYTNADCTGGSICDIGTGECIASTACSQDSHCDIGKICEGGSCRIGCRDTADCDLALREVCIGGQCILGKCENTLYCNFGLVCQHDTHECVQPAENHCAPGCDPWCGAAVCPAVGDSPCGEPTTICAGLDAMSSHCWVACDPEADQCPSGYQCKPTTFAWATCDSVEDCTDVNSASNVLNTCGVTSHRCLINQQVCNTDADCHDFGAPTCLSGYCVIGYHCEPQAGCQ